MTTRFVTERTFSVFVMAVINGASFWMYELCGHKCSLADGFVTNWKLTVGENFTFLWTGRVSGTSLTQKFIRCHAPIYSCTPVEDRRTPGVFFGRPGRAMELEFYSTSRRSADVENVLFRILRRVLIINNLVWVWYFVLGEMLIQCSHS